MGNPEQYSDEYFEIKNISYWKTREGYLDIDQYYEVLLGRMNKCLQKQEEEKRKQEEEEKRKQQEEEDKQEWSQAIKIFKTSTKALHHQIKHMTL